jgi:hypothetical protein
MNLAEAFKQEFGEAPNNSKFSDFIDGQEDCKKGKEADMKRSEDYLRGYSVQYGLEQMQSQGGFN